MWITNIVRILCFLQVSQLFILDVLLNRRGNGLRSWSSFTGEARLDLVQSKDHAQRSCSTWPGFEKSGPLGAESGVHWQVCSGPAHSDHDMVPLSTRYSICRERHGSCKPNKILNPYLGLKICDIWNMLLVDSWWVLSACIVCGCMHFMWPLS